MSSLSAADPVLPSPLPPHPRLFTPSAGWDAVKPAIEKDPVNARIYKSLKIKADAALDLPPLERVMEGRRLLAISRRALGRISTLALVARVEGDARYSQRAIQEMMAVAAFTDWNPSHFLDTGEMSLAVAIGYDWLYADLTPGQRAILEKALVEKGIEPSYEPGQPWLNNDNNWVQVCHAGLCAAAVAIGELEPELAERTIRRAIQKVPAATAVYGPDGAYPEGPMYWGYGTSFHVTLLDLFKQLDGNCHGLDVFDGFAESAEYMQQVTAPSGTFYSYFDARPNRSLEYSLFWFAKHYDRPDWQRYEEDNLERYLARYDKKGENDHYRLLANALLWRLGRPDPAAVEAVRGQHVPTEPPTAWKAGGLEPVAFFRSRFHDPKALYAAIKGGSPGHNHGHMDAGSFILEADGVRWALDLGMEDYHPLESKGIRLWQGGEGGQRWEIFRLGPESHNLLRFNGQPQFVDGMAEIAAFSGTGDRRFAVINLDALYPGQATRVRRGLAFLENRAVLLQDEWTAGSQPAEVDFHWLTPGTVQVEGNVLTLSKDGQTLRLEILEPAGATVKVVEADTLLQPYDTRNPGVSRVTISTRTEAAASGRLRLLAVPGSSGEVAAPAAEALESWR